MYTHMQEHTSSPEAVATSHEKKNPTRQQNKLKPCLRQINRPVWLIQHEVQPKETADARSSVTVSAKKPRQGMLECNW